MCGFGRLPKLLRSWRGNTEILGNTKTVKLFKGNFNEIYGGNESWSL